ncbi:MAG: cobalt-precorrin-6A reductase [Rhodospirillales bacterium]
MPEPAETAEPAKPAGPAKLRGALRLLILGGTRDAAALAHGASARFGPRVDMVSSLAGHTTPPELPGRMRIGGFGGADGLAAHLRAENTHALIDATHPFAARISANAEAACRKTGTPRLMLVRPPWDLGADGPWIEAADARAAAERLRAMAAKRVFLTTGVRGETAAFADLKNTFFLLRAMETPPAPETVPLVDYKVVTGRPPFSAGAEIKLMREHSIDAMVTKNSGGGLNMGKIEAARALRLPTIIIRRPALPSGETAADVEAALMWIENQTA